MFPINFAPNSLKINNIDDRRHYSISQTTYKIFKNQKISFPHQLISSSVVILFKYVYLLFTNLEFVQLFYTVVDIIMKIQCENFKTWKFNKTVWRNTRDNKFPLKVIIIIIITDVQFWAEYKNFVLKMMIIEELFVYIFFHNFLLLSHFVSCDLPFFCLTSVTQTRSTLFCDGKCRQYRQQKCLKNAWKLKYLGWFVVWICRLLKTFPLMEEKLWVEKVNIKIVIETNAAAIGQKWRKIFCEKNQREVKIWWKSFG
jgi:hypothetical protein